MSQPRRKEAMGTQSAPRPASAHVPFALVLGVVAVGFVRIAQYHWREGTVLIAVALLVAAVFRAVLVDEKLGLLVIRGKSVDVLSYTAFGVLIMFVSLTITRGPFN